MVYAAREGDITEVRAAITAGGDVNYCQSGFPVSQYTHTHMYMYSNSIIFECYVKEVYSIYCSITFLYLFDLSCIVNHLFMMTYEFIMNVYSVIRGVATPINF